MTTTSSVSQRNNPLLDYQSDALHQDPCRSMSSSEVTAYISALIQKRMFGDLLHHAENQNTCQDSMNLLQDGVSETNRIRNLAFANKELPVKIDYHIPKIPVGSTIFDSLCSGNTAVQVNTTGYNEMHPLRANLPVRGPGTSNFASPVSEESYVRVAGALSIAATEFVELSLPRHIPVLIDIIVYHMQLATKRTTEEERKKILNEGLGLCNQYVKLLSTFIASLQKALTDSVMTACNEFILKGLGKNAPLIKQSVKTRAQMELEGEGGVVLPASKILYVFLKKTKCVIFEELKQKYEQIATIISFEALSYAKASDVIDTAALKNTVDCNAFKVETNTPLSEVVKDIQNISQTDRSVSSYQQLSPLLRTNHPLRVNFLDSRLGMTNILLNVSTHFDPRNVSDASLMRYRRTDRSNINKSDIQFAPLGEFLKVKEHRKKLNGFQYSLTYNAQTNENTIMARYPQAPQITMYVEARFSFQINVEIHALEGNELRATLISVNYFGPLTVVNPDHLPLVKTLSQSFSFIIKSSVLWRYTKHDGVVFTTKKATYYIKPDKECDLFYHPTEERAGRFVVTHERGKEVIRENDVGSRLLNKHLNGKPEKYLVNLKKRARDNYHHFKLNVVKASDFYVGSQDWYQEAPDIFKNDLQTSVKDLPQVEDCYNVPIIHHNYNHIVVRDAKQLLTVEEMFDVSESVIRPITERVEMLNDSIGGYARKLFDDDFS